MAVSETAYRYNPTLGYLAKAAPEMAFNMSTGAFHCESCSNDEVLFKRKFCVERGFYDDKPIPFEDPTYEDRITEICITMDKLHFALIGHDPDTLIDKIKAIVSRYGLHHTVNVNVDILNADAVSLITYIFKHNYLCCKRDQDILIDVVNNICNKLKIGPREIVIGGLVSSRYTIYSDRNPSFYSNFNHKFYFSLNPP